jgi:hypothetical protein
MVKKSKGIEPNYMDLDIDEKDHWEDLRRSFYEGELVGITSETEGGIIAYAIGQKHANQIVIALNGGRIESDLMLHRVTTVKELLKLVKEGRGVVKVPEN